MSRLNVIGAFFTIATLEILLALSLWQLWKTRATLEKCYQEQLEHAVTVIQKPALDNED